MKLDRNKNRLRLKNKELHLIEASRKNKGDNSI